MRLHLLRRIALFLLAAAPVMAYLIDSAPSPVVHDDGTVTLTVRASQADSVAVAGSLSAAPLPLTRGADGLWTVTVGPLEPGIYHYGFEVDGMRTLDPHNGWVHEGLGASTSLFLVPAEPPAFYETRDVPRGTVHLHHHHSRVLGDERGYEIYTPPGYDDDRRRRFPVLYLLHGYTDTEASWRINGRAPVILDNLIGTGAAEPMVVVMPFGYAPPRPDDVTPGGDDAWTGWFERVTPRVESYLLEELMPRVEAEYRVRDDAASRAVAGLSMGGGQALSFGLAHPGTFAWIGAFSAAIAPVHQTLLRDPQELNRQLELLWIGCGRDDFLYEANTALLARLDSLGVEHTARLTAGSHSWPVWRRYLHQLLQELFR